MNRILHDSVHMATSLLDCRPVCSTFFLEYGVGFEPTALLFCRQFPWTARASVHCNLVPLVGFEPTLHPRRGVV